MMGRRGNAPHEGVSCDDPSDDEDYSMINPFETSPFVCESDSARGSRLMTCPGQRATDEKEESPAKITSGVCRVATSQSDPNAVFSNAQPPISYTCITRREYQSKADSQRRTHQRQIGGQGQPTQPQSQTFRSLPHTFQDQQRGWTRSHTLSSLWEGGRSLAAMPPQEQSNAGVSDDGVDVFDFTLTPGVGGCLEMEKEPPRAPPAALGDRATLSKCQEEDTDLLGLGYEPMRTSSGLLLTHRRTPRGPARLQQQRQQQPRPTENWGASNQNLLYPNQPTSLSGKDHTPTRYGPDVSDGKKKNESTASAFSSVLRFPSLLSKRKVAFGSAAAAFVGRNAAAAPASPLKMDDGAVSGPSLARAFRFAASVTSVERVPSLPPSSGLAKHRRLLSYVRLWIVFFIMLIVVGTGVAAAAVRHERRHVSSVTGIDEGSKEGGGGGGGRGRMEGRNDLQHRGAPGADRSEVSAQSASSASFTSHPGPEPDPFEILDREQVDVAAKVPLIPLHNVSRFTMIQPESSTEGNDSHGHQHDPLNGARRELRRLRKEFDAWVEEHRREYPSEEERSKRFLIWKENHHRTRDKNERHGPCPLTKKAVFGSNHFKDLTPEEFQERFLTGYNGPRTDEMDERPPTTATTDKTMRRRHVDGEDEEQGEGRRRTTMAAVRGDYSKAVAHEPKDPLTSVERHPSVQRRLAEHMERTPPLQKTYIDHWGGSGSSSRYRNQKCSNSRGKTYVKRDRKSSSKTRCYNRSYRWSASSYQSYANGCSFWDLACWFRWLFSRFGYGRGGSMEPAYDADSYPSAIDWRDLGVVTDVHSQGNCGACWAITAVETIESAYAIRTGTVIDLAETEVIVCDGTCEMCNGGWPQNAYEYVAENKGLPPEEYCSYDGDYLLMLSMYHSGESDELSSYEVSNYMAATCPNGGRGGGNSHSGSGSGDNDDNVYATYENVQRYGAVKGYGYSTDRCICYTDGTGCDCDEQNEALAVMNVASYGPATVCLEASLWQDYAGGIMTSECGCSAQFLDMNHCVQVVGYAFIDANENEGGDGDGGDQRSGSGSQKSGGSQDDADRQGYWIVRNQWSSNWGMNGYAYVAMGENTCGILNDMTQVFMKN